MSKILIDPGHGGSDPGAIGNGIKEKDVVLDIAKRIKDGLANYENAEVQLTRNVDISRTLSERTNHANSWGADLFVSIHINAATSSSADGFESFTYPGSKSATKAFQNGIHRSILAKVAFDDRGQKQANFHVLRETHMTSILTENGFISNVADAKKLKDSAFLQRLADGHVIGIAEYLGLKKKPVKEQPITRTLYRVQVGAFANKDNAESFLKKVQDEGFKDSYIIAD
jgi:N-acetylmuramoyl-L-alanine amidase